MRDCWYLSKNMYKLVNSKFKSAQSTKRKVKRHKRQTGSWCSSLGPPQKGKSNLHSVGGRQVGGLPRLTRMKTELINGCVLESNKEVTETLNHVWSLTSLTYRANDEMHSLAVSSQQMMLDQKTLSKSLLIKYVEFSSDPNSCLLT